METLTLTPTAKPKEVIIYPESDGTPMGETDLHRDIMVELIEILKDRYRHDPAVYVSGNLFIYYQKGKPSAVFSPDAFVVFGVPKKQRRTYKLWLEGDKAPNVVFEVSSESTSAEDEGSKKALCRRLGVQEYFLYDPEGEYLYPSLQGYRLENGRYIPIVPEPEKGVYSQVLDVYLRLDGREIQLWDGKTGERLLTPQEAMEARRVAEAWAKEEATARQKAEVELAQLRAELELLRRK